MIGDRWQATDAEVAAWRPCDQLVSPRAVRADRAISIDAPVGTVFRWLCQLRAAPYSYDWLDNLGRRSAPTLTPGLERLATGQRFMGLFALASFEPDEHITLRTRRGAVTYAVRSEGTGTRLATRLAFDVPRLLAPPMLVGDLIMMRKQLGTLKAHAERTSPANRV